MLLAETLAAALVGLLALFVVLRPLIWPVPPAEPVYEPVEQEETPRGVALLALKEIEFDRETGKLSDEDYAFLKGKYTGAALDALRAEQADAADTVAGGGDVEVMIAARVRALRSAATSAPPETPCMDVPSQRHSKAQAEGERPQAPCCSASPDVFLIDRAA